ncbi:MAG: glycosyltransferase family 2 protein [Nitrospina sp.]|nr:glycosyltransferase family 2 protein [Nitrospina sp.]
MDNTKLVSLIIRTKNEERWIHSCLDAVFSQSYKNFEVILVDNESTDKTVEKAHQFPIKEIVSINNYLPGEALNLGIKESKGEYIVCLSAHCIPTEKEWLAFLVNALEEDDNFAGVFGRQEPMSFSTSTDKRDLLLVFGLDRIIKTKDSFFHNANSIIRRKCWEELPFDNSITNIEDRIWAQEMLNRGYKLLYEPEASVYHYHGIHQGGNTERLNNVVKIIEKHQTNYRTGKINANSLKIVAIIPIRGLTKSVNNIPLIKYTIDSVKQSKFVDKVFVSTDSKETAEIAKGMGVECPFIRPQSLSEDHVNLEKVQQFSLQEIEKTGLLPDLVIHMEETYPVRPDGLLDGMILHLLEEGYDSVIAARRESGWLWHENQDGRFERVDSGDIPRKFKEKSLIGLHGLGCVTYPEFIRNGQMLGGKIGLYEVEHPLAGFELRDDFSSDLASRFLDKI